MTNSTKWVAVVAALGWVALNSGEATAQVYYGYQPVGGANRVYSPVSPNGYSVAPNWLGGGYQLPGWFNNSICHVGYLGGNRQVPASLQRVVPGVGFFSINDPYLQQPGSGWPPPSWPRSSVPAFQSPFYNDFGNIVPASGFFPANSSGETETFPGFAVPARPATPSLTTDSPFYR